MMKITLASQNKGKVEEILRYVNKDKIELCISPIVLSPEETGLTFQQNALIKAAAYYEKLASPVLSDDSGLCLDAFPEIMGVDTANFRSDLKSYDLKCKALLDHFNLHKETNTSASFVCHLCYYLSPDEIFFFEGVLKGKISFELKGSNGFGYDPIFIPEGQNFTLAQDSKWKSEHSHRAKAVKSFNDYIVRR